MAAHVRAPTDADADIRLQPCRTPARHSNVGSEVFVDADPETAPHARRLRDTRPLDLVSG